MNSRIPAHQSIKLTKTMTEKNRHKTNQGPEQNSGTDSDATCQVLGNRSSGFTPTSIQKVIMTKQKRSHEKFVPGLPKSIKDVLTYWTEGNLNNGILPIRLLGAASIRAKVLQRYSNKLWSDSGQKNAYKRYRDLVSCVAGFAPLTFDMYGESPYVKMKDTVWIESLKCFHDIYDDNKKPRSLTVVLDFYQKNKL